MGLPPSSGEILLFRLERPSDLVEDVAERQRRGDRGSAQVRGDPPEVERRERAQQMVAGQAALVVRDREVEDDAGPQRGAELELFRLEERQRVQPAER